MTENEISKLVVDAAYVIHTTIGPGLLESAYEKLLTHELTKRNLHVRTQVLLPVQYDELRIDEGYRIDMIVEDKVILELKSVEVLAPVHLKQLLTYLRLSGRHLGLLINFGADTIKHGIRRVVNNLEE